MLVVPMLDKDFFRKILWISTTVSFVVSAVTVALWYSSAGANCPALAETPISIAITVALAWQAIFWRRSLNSIVAMTKRFDNMGFRSPSMVNYNALLMLSTAAFVAISALPLVLYFVRCAWTLRLTGLMLCFGINSFQL
jgi:hypothetical protein